MILIPDFALSVRQPWAWAIIHAGKDIENRNWGMPSARRFEVLAIHASTGMTRDEYEAAVAFMARIGVTPPRPADLELGGIIGHVTCTDIVRASQSPWFMGPVGLVLRDPVAVPFQPARGRLGIFPWRRTGTPAKTAPLKWMREWTPKSISTNSSAISTR